MPQFTFNGTTKRITIDPTFPDVIVSQMYSAWKIWSAESDNFKYLQALRTFGGDATVTGQTAPAFFFLTNGWRVIVDGFDASFSFNLYTDEGEPPIITLTGGTALLNNSDVGIVKTTLEKSLDYQNGEVWVDFIDGEPGAIYPIGTSAQPADNLADAVILCDTFGFHTIRILQGSSIISNITLDNKILIGNSPQQVQLQFEATASIANTRFSNITLSGIAAGDEIYADRCIINSLLDFSGYAYNCGIDGTNRISVNKTSTFYQCASISPGQGSPVIDMNVNGPTSINIRMYSGGLDVINMTDAGDTGTIEYVAGKCRVTSSCTAGYLSIRGVVELTDESLGATIDSGATVTSLLNTADVASAVWNTPYANQNVDGTMGHLLNYTRNIIKQVWINTDLVVNGNGSQEFPFNNITDGIDFAEENNIVKLVLQGDVILDRNVKNFEIRGIGVPEVDVDGRDIRGTHFTEIKIKGQQIGGGVVVRDSVIMDGAFLNGFYENCAFAGSFECMPNAEVFMKDCASGIPGLDRPFISMNSGTPTLLSIRGYSGGLTITNSDHIDDRCTVELQAGSVTFDSTNVSGVMVVRGLGRFIDETNGATVIDETINRESVATAVWAKELG